MVSENIKFATSADARMPTPDPANDVRLLGESENCAGLTGSGYEKEKIWSLTMKIEKSE